MRPLSPAIRRALHEGVVIPAHPLALTANRRLDEPRQRALTRYYLAAGAGGIAVGVHTTQFAIREVGLYEPVLRLAADVVAEEAPEQPVIKIAGICGPTKQALHEAELAAALGYDLGLVSLGGLTGWSEQALLDHIAAITGVIPVFGFYLQPSVGGQLLSYEFWRRCAEISGVMAIKIAPFNRYQTLDVVRAVCQSSRRDDITLYTGNDDNIVADLLTTYRMPVAGGIVEKTIAGGLLGHWAVWTERAVALLNDVKRCRQAGGADALALLARGVAITDSNAAFFDAANQFHGCIAGIHEVLRRQGLLAGRWCLDPAEDLSPGQLAEIDRVYADYPDLNDDAFVARHRAAWLAGTAPALATTD
ncbi:MAG TPA: dihydrodipicolinate synthase family protein [Thermomicrobiales bacterium]|nr:dihydrodipicolinate synthase family protein [Thermomicrobiales bacterium]